MVGVHWCLCLAGWRQEELRQSLNPCPWICRHWKDYWKHSLRTQKLQKGAWESVFGEASPEDPSEELSSENRVLLVPLIPLASENLFPMLSGGRNWGSGRLKLKVKVTESGKWQSSSSPNSLAKFFLGRSSNLTLFVYLPFPRNSRKLSTPCLLIFPASTLIPTHNGDALYPYWPPVTNAWFLPYWLSCMCVPRWGLQIEKVFLAGATLRFIVFSFQKNVSVDFNLISDM